MYRRKENSVQSQFFDEHTEEQNQIADHIFGMVARRGGEPLDCAKSSAWQRGWAETRTQIDVGVLSLVD
jgi:hypothetical protein